MKWICAFDPGARRGGFSAYDPSRKRFHLYNFNPLRVKVNEEWRQVKYNSVKDNWWVVFARVVVNRFHVYLKKARIILIDRLEGRRMKFFTTLILGLCAERYPQAFVYELDPGRWRNCIGAKAKRVKGHQHTANKVKSVDFMKSKLGPALFEQARRKFLITGKENVDALEAMMMTIVGERLETEFKKDVDKRPPTSKPLASDASERSMKLTFDPSAI